MAGAGDATAVLATREMIVYSAPFNTTNVFPLDTIEYGTTWGAPWIDTGYTDGGLSVSTTVNRATITVDQEVHPIARPVTGETITFGTNLAEMDVSNFQLAAGLGTITTVAPATGTNGHDTLAISGQIPDDYNSWGFEALQTNGKPFRGIVWRGLATGSPKPSFGRADTKAVIALEITGLVDSTTSPSRVAEFRNVLPALP